MKVRFAVTPPASALTEDCFGNYLSACEQLKFDTIWLSDIPLGTMGDPVIALSYAAAATTKLNLGANIVPLGRNPMWLAKQLAQIDRLSGGRVLLSFVPGLGSQGERDALGYGDSNRGAAIDDIVDLMRRWWAGERISAAMEGYSFSDVVVHPRPLQSPLEIWLGGKAPAALRRVARLADGWLTSAATPDEAGAGKIQIERLAGEFGRIVDAEHFGISIPVTLGEPDEQALQSLRSRREDGDLSQIVAIGPKGLRALLDRHLDQGLSKFVLRPLNAMETQADWRRDLDWIAETALPLQT
ncbi:MAG: LLM class flavin-dependent oxidoreductase [Pseudomonadota bacterium]